MTSRGFFIRDSRNAGRLFNLKLGISYFLISLGFSLSEIDLLSI